MLRCEKRLVKKKKCDLVCLIEYITYIDNKMVKFVSIFFSKNKS